MNPNRSGAPEVAWSRRSLLAPLAVVLLVVSIGLAGGATPAAARPKKGPTTTTTTPTTTTAPTTTAPTTTTPPPPPPVEAVSVLSHGADSSGTLDSTAAFLRAQDAALASDLRFGAGPGGAPQAVVSVPAGTYRLLRLPFRSNIRMEVNAAAVLQQAGGRDVDTRGAAPALIFWDGPPGFQLTNVTLIGVSSSAGGLKSLADPVFPGWSLNESFTFNLDPGMTDASTLVTGLQALNVRGFLIQNVYSIQNDFQPAVPATTDAGWWPQTRKAAMGLRSRNDAPADGSAYYDPHQGSVVNWYNIRAPKGFGPNQVNAGHDVTFSHIFSSGGTPMRFETDASQGKSFASEIRGIRAYDIAGRDCNRSVIFAPHAQNNHDVHVSGVQSVGCGQGVEESIDESNAFLPGSFVNSTITDVTVTAGPNAQIGIAGSNGAWTAGPSDKAFAKDRPNQSLWSVVYTAGTYRCSGAFVSPSDLLQTTAGQLRPVCT